MKKIVLALSLMIAVSSVFAGPGAKGVNTSQSCVCQGVGLQNQHTVEPRYNVHKYPQIRTAAHPTTPKVLRTIGFTLFIDIQKWIHIVPGV